MAYKEDDGYEVAEKSTKQLKSVAGLFKGIHGQLAEDRVALAQASGQIANSAKQFQSYLSSFKTFEASCKQYVVDKVKKEMRQSVAALTDEMCQRISDPIEHSINTLEDVSAHFDKYFELHANQRKSSQSRIIIVLLTAFLGGLIGGVVGAYLPHSSSISQLTTGPVETTLKDAG